MILFKSHDSIPVPLLGRGVFTAGFAPARPFPTPTYKCVGGSRSRKSRLVARRRLASSSSFADPLAALSARCLSWFTGRFNHPTPSSRLWCIPTQCAALQFLSGLSPLRSPLLHNPGVHAGALGFNPMLLPKMDRREIPRSRDRGNPYRSNPGSPSIRGSGSCLRLCRVVFACYTPTGGSRPIQNTEIIAAEMNIFFCFVFVLLWSQSGRPQHQIQPECGKLSNRGPTNPSRDRIRRRKYERGPENISFPCPA